MTIVRKRLADLKPHPRNPRRMDAEAKKGLAASVREFGMVEPVVWNKRTGYVLGGHQRLALLREKRVKEIEVSVVDLEPKRELTLLLALNNPATQGVYTSELDGLLAELGKDLPELTEALLLPEIEIAQEEKAEIVEDTPPEPPKKPVSKTGDLWLLGDHRLLCGDSTKAEDVARVMDGKRAVLMATDPPYGVDYAKVKDGIPRPGFRTQIEDWGNISGDDLKDAALGEFLTKAFKAASEVALLPNAAWYLWHAHLTAGFFSAAAAAAAADVLLHRQIIWRKPHLILTRSGMYHWQHEPCFFGWRRGHKPPWYGSKSQTSVWEIGQERDRLHQTQKPVELFAIPIRNHTRKGEVVYEPFSGSGTQIVAAEQLGRRAYALEIEPRFVDVAVLRWQNLTRKRATHEKTGKPFPG